MNGVQWPRQPPKAFVATPKRMDGLRPIDWRDFGSSRFVHHVCVWILARIPYVKVNADVKPVSDFGRSTILK